ncbi:M48 family metalloprotease [Thalassovita sp.]|uniref:M48 family metalloprotease n=1 Tax=Thalassovita sp. TaxID=1979401 RepID=UPI002B267941|nr:M48 family metalloprotease [Thalassovita sp.]
MRRFLILLVALGLSGCMEPSAPADKPVPTETAEAAKVPQEPSRKAAKMFVDVVAAVEPVAEALCHEQAPHLNCDFRFVVDEKDAEAANAHQFLSRKGQPILSFNYAMLNTVRNPEELAFVIGHEAGHHIAGHLARQEVSARHGASVMAELASVNGATRTEIKNARKLGAVLGMLQYSKEFELEADQIGTIISIRAGYDPLIGVRFFNRLPSPADEMLGTHPPNGKRIALVRQTAREHPLSAATW